jgi:hypothetical protein
MLAHQACQVQVGGLKVEPQFFLRFTAGGGIGRFASGSIELSTTGAPKTEVWLLRTLHQQHPILFVETIQQRRDFVREGRHSYLAKAA